LTLIRVIIAYRRFGDRDGELTDAERAWDERPG
jgi:hypothetical protein